MDLGTLGGIALGLLLIIGTMVAGGSLTAFIHIPSMAVTMGGTAAAVLINFPLAKVKAVFAVTRKTINAGQLDLTPWYSVIVEMATIARRDGILALEERLATVDDDFLKRGLQMIVDGNPPEVVESILDKEIDNMEDRHMIGHAIFKNMGNYAPAFGMIGTLMGLVQMLRNLDDPSQIGAGMAVALLTTFYGAFYANLFCLPLQGKLEQRTAEEVQLKRMLLTGILSIHAGDSPRIVGDKLLVYLNPSDRETDTEEAA